MRSEILLCQDLNLLKNKTQLVSLKKGFCVKLPGRDARGRWEASCLHTLDSRCVYCLGDGMHVHKRWHAHPSQYTVTCTSVKRSSGSKAGFNYKASLFVEELIE